jgi:hypothetical protein
VGNKVTFKSTCPACKHQGRYRFELSDLEYYVPDPITREGRTRVDTIKPRENLPDYEWQIHWHLMTQRDSKYLTTVIEELVEEQKKESNKKYRRRRGNPRVEVDKEEGEEELTNPLDIYSTIMVPRVDKVVEPDSTEVTLTRGDGEFADERLNKKQSIEYIKHLPSRVRLEFKDLVDEHSPGLNTDIYFDCENCSRELVNVVFALSRNFWFPEEMES